MSVETLKRRAGLGTWAELGPERVGVRLWDVKPHATGVRTTVRSTVPGSCHLEVIRRQTF